MARGRTIEVGVLNIKTHPHSPERYVKLMQDLFRKKPIAHIWGKDHGTPKSIFFYNSDDPLLGLYGYFYKFMDIDQSMPWIDTEQRQTIVTEEGEPIPQVAENKKPNTREIEFVFFPRGHRLFFNMQFISPKNAKNLVENLFSNEFIRRKYGAVDVEVESSREVIDRILQIPYLTKLRIDLTRPNSDDIDDLQEAAMDRLTGQKIRRLKQEASSDRGDGIEPDDQTVALMTLATSNGTVSAEGYDGERKVIESTKPHPFTERYKYDTDSGTFISTMYNACSESLARILRRR